MLAKNISVSRRSDCRRLSSKSGNSSEFGSTLLTLRSCSHWPAKLLTSACDFGSASMRRTCCSSTAGDFSLPWLATFSSSSSGMLLQRKNDKRDASSRSSRRYALPAGTSAGSRSTRNTNRGLARMACRAASNAGVEIALAPALLEKAEQRLAGRRRSPAADTHAGSRCRESPWRTPVRRPRLVGRHEKIRRRLGVSPGPVGAKGPVIVSV